MSSFLDVWAPGPIAECIIGYLELEDLLELRSRRRSLLLAVGRHSDAWLQTLLQCPIFAAVPGAPFAGLPANPFIAKIVDGKCVCPSPQSCDA